MTERALSVRDVAAEYGVTPATVYGWIKDGRLRPLKLPGGDFRFRRAQLDEFDAKCLAASSTAPTTDSDSGEGDGSSTGQTRPPAEPGPFQRGRLSVVPPRSGGTSG